MSRIIKCDRCGGEIQEGEIGYVSMMQRTKDGDLCGDNPFEKLDFCPRCMELIGEYVSGEKPTRAEKKPAKPAKKKELDVPKMRALQEGGWSIEKIADEMGCSTPTVRKYLSMERTK